MSKRRWKVMSPLCPPPGPAEVHVPTWRWRPSCGAGGPGTPLEWALRGSHLRTTPSSCHETVLACRALCVPPSRNRKRRGGTPTPCPTSRPGAPPPHPALGTGQRGGAAGFVPRVPWTLVHTNACPVASGWGRDAPGIPGTETTRGRATQGAGNPSPNRPRAKAKPRQERRKKER